MPHIRAARRRLTAARGSGAAPGGAERNRPVMDDLLLIVMRGGMTRAERTMLDFGQHDLLRGFRQTFENEMSKV
jgi:hypothetical protein